MSTRKARSIRKTALRCLGVAAVVFPIGLTINARVLDNFNDNTRTGWEDKLLDPRLPSPSESGHQLKIQIPQAFVQASPSGLFTATVKTSEEFTISEGRTVEFCVDLVQGAGNDSYAVLAFLPNSYGPETTIGYALAKSANEILIVKALNHYFLDDDSPAAAVKHNNVKLVLSLSGSKDPSGKPKVTITGRIIDNDTGTVLWEQTRVDTEGVDFGNEGELLSVGAQKPFIAPNPPSLGKGRFALYLYAIKRAPLEDDYFAVFDNAQVFVTETIVLDDFNDNIKTAWEDKLLDPRVPPPTESAQQFKIQIPQVFVAASPAGLFTATVKTTREFEIQIGERLELAVDLLQGAGNDAYAVLAFLPNGYGPETTIGYALAKSANEIVLVKALNHYFLDDDSPAATVKHNNVKLVLSLTGDADTTGKPQVHITGRIIDNDTGTVIWNATRTDTEGADFGNEGELLSVGAQKPFIAPNPPSFGKGRFALYLYAIKRAPLEDDYFAVFDNATVAAPPAAGNQPPVISDISPISTSNFLPASTTISFRATDDAELSPSKISITLNGTKYTTANGLSVAGTAASKTVSLSGKLQPNVNYTAVLSVEDEGGLVATRTVFFDTFALTNMVIEIEDYNFDGGSYINNPIPIPEGFGPTSDSYNNQIGIAEIDFHDTRTSPNGVNTMYRTWDPVRMQHSMDIVRKKFVEAGGADNFVFDYDVGDIAAGEWLMYTRNFSPGSYEVYLREALLNMTSGESVLEQVVGETTKVLGAFIGSLSGFNYRNVPLTDGTGLNKIVLRLSGTVTFRLRHITPDPSDGARYLNYMVFVPVEDTGIQRATVQSVSPAPDTIVATAFPVITAVIQNRDTSVDVSTVKLEFNGTVAPATVTQTTEGASVTWKINPLPPADTVNTAKISFKDTMGVTVSTEWSFTLSYLWLDPATRVMGPGKTRGFTVRVVQAPKDGSVQLENSLTQAENQLAGIIPSHYQITAQLDVINLSQNAPWAGQDGYFPDDQPIPGLAELGDGTTDDIALEATTWLELPAGAHRFGIISDDGFKVSSSTPPLTRTSPALALKDSGTANMTFDVVVIETGFYAFRFVWFEHQGGAHVEWFTVNPDDPNDRTLINSSSTKAIKAYTNVELASPLRLQSAPS
ncbi:MAG: hypothetical protein N3G20_02935, partial [Verrucomicrobiae bacterium]|nr:hypothetical protein [Verrucomicrobiae bacterium]